MKNKTRKSKKILMVAAIALMVALVAAMGTMTYSRYITSGKTEQTATAAKWGFVVNVSADDLLGTDYTYDNEKTAATVVASDTGVAVNASGAGDIVAPGTTGSMTFSAVGVAEVLAQLTFTVNVSNEIWIDLDHNGVKDYENDYFPIVWTLQKQGGATNTSKNLAALLTGITSTKIAPGTDASTAVGTYTLSWAWPLENSTGAGLATNNIYDTVIGIKAVTPTKAYNTVGTTIGVGDLFVDALQIKSAISETQWADTYTSFEFTLSINIEQIQQ